MNVVLYTRDFEPITVIDLPMWAIEHAMRQQFVHVAHIEEPQFLRFTDQIDDTAKLRFVTLEFHELRLPRDRSMYLVTVDDEETALLLRPAWLPGQRAKINQYERNNKRLASMLLDVLSRGIGGR
jgi:hypothetical protein